MIIWLGAILLVVLALLGLMVWGFIWAVDVLFASEYDQDFLKW